MPLLLSIALAVLALDHLTKWLAIEYLQGHPPVPIVPGLLRFDYAENLGGAFSIMADRPLLLTFVASIALVVIVVFALKTPREERLIRIGFALMIGGAVANLIDRFFRGAVVDFIDAYWGNYHWPTFNVADSAICVGAALIVIRSFFVSDAPEPNAEEAAAEDSAREASLKTSQPTRESRS